MAENHLVFRGIRNIFIILICSSEVPKTGSTQKGYTKTHYNKFSKVKDRTLKGTRQSTSSHVRGIPIRLWRDFSQKPCRSRGSDSSHNPDDMFNVLKVFLKWPRILYLTKLSLNIKGEINIFPDKQSWGSLPPLEPLKNY